MSGGAHRYLARIGQEGVSVSIGHINGADHESPPQTRVSLNTLDDGN